MYPTLLPSTLPSSGHHLYLFLLDNVKVPAESSHTLWYNGVAQALEIPETSPFRGYFPVGTSLELIINGKPTNYTFTGEEKQHTFVKDLTPKSKQLLNIPETAKDGDKVFNYNFVVYDDLPRETRISNELTTLALAKSLSSYLSRHIGLTYSEYHVAQMLREAIVNLASDAMMHILHGNHLQWATLNYVRDGAVQPDTRKEFYGQSDVDFYVKDIGTILPSMFYACATIGVNPVELVEASPSVMSIWGAMDAAVDMQNRMKINEKQAVAL